MPRLLVFVALLLMLAAAVAAPLLAERSSPAAVPLYGAFSWICQQRPQRAWLLGGFPLAVCIRCLGLYAGALAGAAAGLRFFRLLMLGSMALLGAEWLVEACGWLAAPPLARFATGLLAGFFLVPALWGEQGEPILRIPWRKGEARP